MLPVWCGIGIASVGLAIFSLGSDRIVARILICSVVLSLIRGLTAVELFRQAKGRPFVKGFAIWFASIAILSLNRVVLTPLFGAPSDFMRADIIQSSNLALSAIWVCMLGVFFLLMLCGELVAVVEAQTDRDSLSGCLNRRGIEKCLTYELKNMHRTHHKLSVALIDIDTFKEINDTRGHAAGDGVLRDLVSIVSEHLRPTDPFGRYGGDEFLLLLPRASREQAFIIAERLRQAVTTAFERDNRLAITLSVGIAEADSDEPLDSLLERADKALYEAKRTGRNRTRSLPYVRPAAHQLTDGRATLIASGLS
jgi:diguanylate cyclase (GGDEF)-like protein